MVVRIVPALVAPHKLVIRNIVLLIVYGRIGVTGAHALLLVELRLKLAAEPSQLPRNMVVRPVMELRLMRRLALILLVR